MRIFVAVGAVTLMLASQATAQTINFGNDSGDYSNDGECDDGRFAGPGMTSTNLIQDDLFSDATDCRNAYEAGNLTLRGVASDGTVDFGDDSSDYANDGECDDMRFEGPGLTSTDLLEDDIMTDATDCRIAFEAGNLKLAGQ